MNRRLVVYIAGPYRAKTPYDVEINVRRAEAIALKVWRAGGVALCPHTMCRFYDGSAPDEVWLEGTLELLRRSDALLLAEGWKLSEGSSKEHHEANKLGFPIFLDFEGSLDATLLKLIESPTGYQRK